MLNINLLEDLTLCVFDSNCDLQVAPVTQVVKERFGIVLYKETAELVIKKVIDFASAVEQQALAN